MSTKAPGEILELFRGGYLSMAETTDALDTVEGYVSVELLNIERAISDDLREQNAKLREAAVGGEAVNDIVRKIVYQMSPSDQYDLAFKVAENVGYMLIREHEHPDSPHLAAPPASPLRGREVSLLADRLRWLNNQSVISLAQAQEICGKLGEIIFFLDQFTLPRTASDKE